MKKNYVKTSFIVYIFIFLLFTIIFFFFFHTSIFNKQSVLFYRGIILLFATTIITSIILFILNKHFLNVSKETLFSAIIVIFSLHLCFFVVFPVTFDRSITTYLLSVLERETSSNSCQIRSEKNLEEFLINEYIIKNKAVRRRLDEQAIIDNVKEDHNCIKLSSRGTTFVKLSKIIMKIYTK